MKGFLQTTVHGALGRTLRAGAGSRTPLTWHRHVSPTLSVGGLRTRTRRLLAGCCRAVLQFSVLIVLRRRVPITRSQSQPGRSLSANAQRVASQGAGALSLFHIEAPSLAARPPLCRLCLGHPAALTLTKSWHNFHARQEGPKRSGFFPNSKREHDTASPGHWTVRAHREQWPRAGEGADACVWAAGAGVGSGRDLGTSPEDLHSSQTLNVPSLITNCAKQSRAGHSWGHQVGSVAV